MTEREIVLRERAAFEAGASFHYQKECERVRLDRSTASHHIDYTVVQGEAKRRYAVKITRPRVVPDSKGVQWRFLPDQGAQLQFKVDGDCMWYAMLHNRYGSDFKPTPERIKIWADLLANPNETVEE